MTQCDPGVDVGPTVEAPVLDHREPLEKEAPAWPPGPSGSPVRVASASYQNVLPDQVVEILNDPLVCLCVCV